MSITNELTTEISIRFKDIDAMGHVNNALYFTYFEEARKSFLKKVFDISDPSEYPFILAKVSCDYIKPIKLNDTVSVKIWISKISDKSFIFSYEIFNANNKSSVYCKGESVMVIFDYQKNETIKISDDFYNKIKKYYIK